jgi:putative SOS response-associated peptidase YedK
MCGRYTIRRPELIRAGFRHQPTFGFEEFSEIRIAPRFNVAPSQLAPIVCKIDKGYQLLLARWGLVPGWSKEKPKYQPINARCETVATSGMFKQAFAKRRCLVPADGFYEWRGSKAPKQPFFIHLKSDGPFAFAGLHERWKPAEGEAIETFTILTTCANPLMQRIHQRMPVMLRESDYERWLGGKDVGELLRPFEGEEMEAYAVSGEVNSPKNDGAELVEKVEDEGLFGGEWPRL